MCKIIVVYLVILIFFSIARCETDPKKLTFVIFRDSGQHKISSLIIKTFKFVEVNYYPELKLDEKFIVLDSETTKDQFCAISQSGFSAILDFSRIGFRSELASLSFSLGIPYLHIDATIQSFFKAMETYLAARKALDSCFIVSNDQEVNDILYYVAMQSKLRVIVIDDLDSKKVGNLRNIRPYPSYFSLLSSTDDMNRLFQTAFDGKLVKYPDKWNLLFTDFEGEKFKYRNALPNVSQLVLDKDICCKFLGIQSDCICPPDVSIQELHLRNVLKSIIPVLIQRGGNLKRSCVHNASTTIEEHAISDRIEADLHDAIANNPLLFIDDYNNLTLRYAYNFFVYGGSGGEMRQQGRIDEPVATLDNKNGLRLIKTGSVQPTRRMFRIGVVHSVPWSYHKTDPNTGQSLRNSENKPIWEGYCIEFIEALAQRMNFDYELVVPKTGKFGRKLAHDKWDGIVGDLFTGETDMAIAPLKMTAQREEVIDFVTPYFEQTGILIMMRDPVIQTSLFKFMTVLRLEVWLSIVVALVASSVMLWFLDTYSPYSSRNHKDAYPYPCREFTLKESFWFTLTSFTPQGGGEAPKSLSGRTLVAAYWLFVVLMLATFTANLAAFLTVERMKTPVQNLDQLARQSRINYTVVENSDVHQYFINMKFAEDTLYRMWKEITLNSSSDETQYRIWEYPIKEQYGNILLAINSSIPVKDPEEGYRKVNEAINADFAFIHDAAEIKYQLARNCNLTQVGEVFAEQPYAVGVQQGSHLHDEISRNIIELQHDRFFEQIQSKYWNNSLKGHCPNSDESEGITLDSLGGVFIATLFGLALAMITLVGEIIYHRKIVGKKDIIGVNPVKIISKNPIKVSPAPPPYSVANLKAPKGPVTIGDQFMPVRQRSRPMGDLWNE